MDNPWRQWKNPPPDFRLVIHSVQPGSQAEKLGLQRGLGIFAINYDEDKKELKNLDDLKKSVKSLNQSEPFLLSIAGKQQGKWVVGSVKVKPGKFD